MVRLLELTVIVSCIFASACGPEQRRRYGGGGDGDDDGGSADDVSAATSSVGAGSTAGGSTAGGGPVSPGSGEHAVCVDTINQYRAAIGLPQYARWTEAETCSDGEAESDSGTGSPHGAFGQCGEWAQNECPGWEGPAETVIVECLAMMWDEGPGGGHHDAMASTEYVRVACGFHDGGGGVWSVQNFQ